jgi:hypothetical protein
MLPGKHRVTAIVAAAVLALTGLGAAAEPLDEANERTRRLVQQAMKDQRIPDLQVTVVKDARVVLSEDRRVLPAVAASACAVDGHRESRFQGIRTLRSHMARSRPLRSSLQLMLRGAGL